jgi:phosphate-selective porin
LLLGLLAAPAFAQGPAAPIDPAEANIGSDVPPLRIGAVTITGSAHVDALKVNGDPRDEFRDEFRIRRARLGLAGNLTPSIGWNVSAEFTATPVLRNAFIQVRFSPYAALRLGQANPPMSIERGTSPTAIEFIDRTRITSQLTYAQDVGATLLNERPLAHWLSYAFSVVNGAGFNRSDDNDAKDLVGRVEVAPPLLRHTSFRAHAASSRTGCARARPRASASTPPA